MINKNISKMLGSILGIIGFMLSIGVLEVPVLADDNMQTNSSYSTSLDAYKDYSLNINKSAEQNGVKVTIDKVVGTKHKIKVVVKVENEKPFDETKIKKKIKNLTEKITFGGIDYNGYSSSYDYPDDKTIVITTTQHNDKEEYPEKGELRVDMVLPEYKINIGIDATVDFSESFNKVIEEDISAKIPELNFTINKLESDVMGTRIVYSEPKQDYSVTQSDLQDSQKSAIILKVGDKMYPMGEGGSYHSGNVINNELIMKIYESECATYDRVKDKKDISIIPIISNMTSDESNKIYENVSNNEKREANKETRNNVSYIKSFEFSDGSKGEIYNIERNDNSVKVYCKGNSEKESLLMATCMSMNYDIVDSNLGYNPNYNSSKHMSFYKDSKDSLGYVVEFDNIEKDKPVELDFEDIIKQIDKFKVGEEIKISK